MKGKYVFTFELGGPAEVTVLIATEEDHKAGYAASGNLPKEIRDLMDQIGGEMQEGIYEVRGYDEALKILLENGLTHNQLK